MAKQLGFKLDYLLYEYYFVITKIQPQTQLYMLQSALMELQSLIALYSLEKLDPLNFK